MKSFQPAKLFPVCAILVIWLLPFAGFGNVAPQCPSPQMTYFGGPVLANVQVVPVFYGPLVNAQVITNMPQFYADITGSGYLSWLCEYDTPSQHIGLGTATAGYVITSVATVAKSTTVTDASLQTLLVQQVALGNLPPPNSNTLYMVHFPSFVQLTGPAGSGTSCVDFCAYHNCFASGTNVYVYAAIMDTFTGGCALGCGGNSSGLDNQTDTAAHELIESITDPYVGLDTSSAYAYPCGWADNNNFCGEVGDVCDDGGPGDVITVSGRSWVVQEMWSDCQNRCTSTGPLPVARSQNLTVFPETPVPITLTLSNASSFCHYRVFAVTNGPAHGILSGTAPNLVYTPAAGFTGEDSFRFTANGSPGTVNITVALMITSADFDATKTNFVVCWNSQPGTNYTVLTNSTLSAWAGWRSAGATNAVSTNTCFTFPGKPVAGSKMFVAVKKN